MSSAERHTNAMNRLVNSTMPPHRKVSLEHGYTRTNGGMGTQPSMANMNMHQMHMNEMMMMDYTMMGLDPDPYNMDFHFMPMHPAEAAAMGPMMDQMMDFPPPRFMPPMQRHPNKPPRNAMLPDLLGSMEDFESEYSHTNLSSPQHRIMHNAGAPRASASFEPPMNSAISHGKKRERAPSSTSFPTKLYKILSDPECQECIAWLPHGRAWRVLKPKALEEYVIPKFFRSDRYASFMRQVNGWGFKRITEGVDLNAYYHEMFLRGLPHVCAKMRRPIKGEAGGNKELGQHPDFYKISRFAPLPGERIEQHGLPLPAQKRSKTKREAKQPAVDPKESPGVVSSDEPDSKIEGSDEKSRDVEASVAKSPEPNQDAKKTGEDSISSTEKLATVDAVSPLFMTPADPLESPPRPSTAQSSTADTYGVRTPLAYSEGQNYGGSHASCGGESISSWNEPPDQDVLWSSSLSVTSSTLDSPPAPQGFAGESIHALPNNCFGNQVTPPGGRMPFMWNRGGLHQRQHELMRLPHGNPSLLEEADTSGLSVADLCYLTEQNRILLSQANRRADVPK